MDVHDQTESVFTIHRNAHSTAAMVLRVARFLRTEGRAGHRIVCLGLDDRIDGVATLECKTDIEVREQPRIVGRLTAERHRTEAFWQAGA
jgi:hypothetical protein